MCCLIGIIEDMSLRGPQTLEHHLKKEISGALSVISFCELSPLQEKSIKSFSDVI